jgi:hypothetical protein
VMRDESSLSFSLSRLLSLLAVTTFFTSLFIPICGRQSNKLRTLWQRTHNIALRPRINALKQQIETAINNYYKDIIINVEP